jgi:hypothetical protein
MEFVISIGSFILILLVIIAFRSRGSRIEIKTPDIIVAILPAFIFLILTGKLSKFELSESGLKIESAISEAASSKISGLEKQLEFEKLPTIKVNSNTKGSVQKIPKLINDKTEALTFYLGYQGYYDQAIYKYISELTEKPYLKYLIFLDAEGNFYAMSSARRFIKENPKCCLAYSQLEHALVNNNIEALHKLIPDLITVDGAISSASSRRETLKKMLDLKVDTLPVLDGNKKLIGMVDKASISGSLLLEIVSKMDSTEK